MIKLSIPDMSCGHCTAAITKALKTLDSNAEAEFDLTARTASVTATADEATILAILAEAGYPAARA